LDDVIAAQPSVRIPEETQPFDDESESECDNLVEEITLRSDLEEYIQPASAETHPSQILADVFHEMDKVCRTISKKHTHHDTFATAFSNTMLVTDKRDKLRVEAYLTRKKLSKFEIFCLENLKWCWKQVRRYIPEKDLLYHLLDELFKCWGPVKCTITGQALFTEETSKKSKGVLHDV
jgi:hypothetical protein